MAPEQVFYHGAAHPAQALFGGRVLILKLRLDMNLLCSLGWQVHRRATTLSQFSLLHEGIPGVSHTIQLTLLRDRILV